MRRKYIEKANGKLRPLGIPTVKDRIAAEIKGLGDAWLWFQALLLTNNREETLNGF